MDYFSESLNEPILDSGLDIFEKPVKASNFSSETEVIIQPTCPPSDSPHASFKFILGGKDDRMYSIPSSIKIFGRLKVTLQNGADLTDEEISVVCNFPETIFENIKVTLNGTPISDHGRGYGFKSYIAKKLSMPFITKSSSLLSHYWVEDGDKDGIRVDGTRLSDSFKSRKEIIKKSADVYFVFPLMVDLFNTERYIPPYTEIIIELERAPVTLPLLSDLAGLNAKIQIMDINMAVRRFTPHQSLILDHEKRMKRGDRMILPFTRTSVRYRTLHPGVLSTVVPGCFTGQLPYSMIVGFLTNEQLSEVTHNPFIFNTQNLRKFNVVKNGVSIPQDPVNVGELTGGGALLGYTHFIENIGSNIFTHDSGITPDDYFNRSFFIAYDFTPDKTLGANNYEQENGTIDLCLQFKKTTTTPLTLIVLGCFENTVQFNMDDTILDYTL